MTRTGRALLMAVVVLTGGGIAAYFAWKERQGAEGRELAEVNRKRLFDFGRDHVERGELKRGNVVIRFERDPGGWRLTEPLRGPADAEAIGAMLDHMAGIRIDATVDDDATEAELAEYGLAPAPLSLSLELKSGKKLALYVGEKDPLSGRFFVTDHERKRIGAAAAAFHWALDRDLHAFRSKRIFEISRDAVQRVSVSKGGEQRYLLEKGSDGWTVTADGKTLRADSFVVDRFLLLLTRDLKAESFVTDELPDDPRALAVFGLDPPAFTVTVEGGAGEKYVARVGGMKTVPAPDGGAAGEHEGEEAPKAGPFVSLEGSSTVADVYDAFLEDLDKDLETYRDHTIGSFETEQVAKVLFELPSGERAIVERKSGTGEEARWMLTLPQTTAARSWRIEKIVQSFSRLRSDRVYADAPAAAKRREWQLDPPQQRLVFHDASGAVLASVLIGKKADNEHVFITVEGLDRVDVVKEARLALLPKALPDLVERGGP